MSDFYNFKATKEVCLDVVDAIEDFCLNSGLKPNISYHDNCWIWIK